MTAGVVRVLVVDDSAFVRKIVKQMLSRSPFIEVVGAARDGAEALAMVADLNPDVVTLDLVMPVMDGVEFLKRQMATRPLPVVICSISHESGAAALEALEAGAVDFIQKPTALATDRIFEIADELVAKVKSAASIRLKATDVPAVAPTLPELPAPIPNRVKGAQVVVIGISTGGPQALRYLVPRFPANFPAPIAIVLHMPVGYTEMYAGRLNDLSALEVVEAHEGDVARPGVVLLAPAGRHLLFERQPDGAVKCHLDVRPFDTPHRPAVDVLFRSASDVYGERVLGVVMTGMGNDGLVGASYVKARGGTIFTEAESSCTVYGMPRAVDEAMVSDRSLPLQDMAASIMEMV
ncbi:MAG: Chemotaxis response regulator protein-glutamate methylesterase [Gemmatimonadetes bacterium]|nr:Chemotaxis response regulator protein-glutamate methylesterase [Gemmatimonadota bacterium]